LDAATTTSLAAQVQNDPRIAISRKALFNRIAKETHLQINSFSEADLWNLTDSAMLNAGLTSYRDLSNPTTLFFFPHQSYTVKAWLDYVRTIRQQQRAGAGGRTDKELFDQYMERSALEYYRSHLEEYNTDFAFQLNEFREGNLLFEVMQRKIWDKASADSAGLRSYYEAHKDKYWWESSADALLFTCNNQKTADAVRKGLDMNLAGWRKMTDTLGASVQADSGRYETAQIPGPPGLSRPILTPGQATPFVHNPSDNTVSFAYVLKLYPTKEPRNYRDARGFVINDYQGFLEEQWIATLKKKYPVKIEETAVAALPK
jgi:peptidyl-prolyl cis-trans isomerase SurA